MSFFFYLWWFFFTSWVLKTLGSPIYQFLLLKRDADKWRSLPLSQDDSWTCCCHVGIIPRKFPLPLPAISKTTALLFSILHHVSSLMLYINESIVYLVFVSIFYLEFRQGIVSIRVCYLLQLSVSHWVNKPQCVDGHWGSFQFGGAIMKRSTMYEYILLQIFLWLNIFISYGSMPRCGIARPLGSVV